ncbi:transmembrane protein 192 [Synchiropus picturatus]
MNSRRIYDAQPVDPAAMTGSIEETIPDDGPLISADALHSAISRDFQKIPIWHTVLLSLVHVVFVVLAVVLAAMCLLKLGNADECAKILGGMSGTNVIAFGKACLWVLVQLYTEYSHRHHSNARKRGYLRFYRQTKSLKNLPITVHSAGTVAFLVVQAVGLSSAVATYLLIGILALELILVVPFLIYHLATVWKHNSRRPAPDVCEDEHSQNVPGRTTETGFREGSNLEEVVEKQSDLIEYLMEHNRALSTRLLNLTVQH